MLKQARGIGEPVAATDSNKLAILYLCVGLAVFSIQDVIVKWFSSTYAAHEIVFARSVVAAVLILLFQVFVRKDYVFTTRQPLLHLLRGLIVFVAFTSFYMAIAAMPLAEVVAIALSAPLVITAMSVFILGERVGLLRWLAVFVGLAGVLLIVRPTSSVFEPAALLALLCTVTYATSQMMSRHLGRQDSGSLMALYIALFYVVGGGLSGLLLGHGEFQVGAHPSLAFLTRAWVMPGAFDFAVIFVIGLASAIGFYCLTQAYRIGESSAVAPFEYSGMIWAMIWGALLFGEYPDWQTYAGIGLIVAAGLFVLRREKARRRPLISKRGRLRIRSGL